VHGLKKKYHLITFTVGQGTQAFSVVHLPVWITQREDVRSICVRRAAFRVKHVKSSASVLESLLHVVGHGCALGPKLVLATPPGGASIEMRCVGILASRFAGLLAAAATGSFYQCVFLPFLASKYCT